MPADVRGVKTLRLAKIEGWMNSCAQTTGLFNVCYIFTFLVTNFIAPLFLQGSLQQNEHDELHGKSAADRKKNHSTGAKRGKTQFSGYLSFSCTIFGTGSNWFSHLWCLVHFQPRQFLASKCVVKRKNSKQTREINIVCLFCSNVSVTNWKKKGKKLLKVGKSQGCLWNWFVCLQRRFLS